MKSVSFSEIVFASDVARWLLPRQARRRLLSFATVMVLGLSGLIALFHLADPTAPLAYVVVPVMAGGLLPLFLLMPARFKVTTRFEARHLINTVEEGLGELGYEQVAGTADALRYRPRGSRWLHWPAKEIAVAVRPHAIDITGPVVTLRALQKLLAR